MPPLKVDPGMLQRFSGNTSGVSGVVGGLNLAGLDGCLAALPGTDVGGAVAAAGGAGQRMTGKFAQRLTSVSDIAKGSGNNYDITEDEFKSKLDNVKLGAK